MLKTLPHIMKYFNVLGILLKTFLSFKLVASVHILLMLYIDPENLIIK